MRILVLWADHRSANLGVRVLAEGAGIMAQSVFPGAHVDFQDFAPNADGFNPGKSSVARDILRPNGPVKAWLKEYDLVLDTGAGDSLTDIYGAKRLLMMLYTQRAAVECGIPIVYLPQTIGPFKSRTLRRLSVSNLKRASAVFARDSISHRYAQAELGIDSSLSTDLVFTLPTQERARNGRVAINVSGLLWNPNPHVSHEAYRRELARLHDGLAEAGFVAELVPHVLSNPSGDDDVAILNEAADYLGAMPTDPPRDLLDVRRRLASADAVIGSRMHACLNALSQGVPAFSWAYSRKFAPLLADIGWSYGGDLRDQSDLPRDTVKFAEVSRSGGLDDGLEGTLSTARARLDESVKFLRSKLVGV